MVIGIFVGLLLAVPAQNPGGQAFRLGPGEYRWVPFTVKVGPSEVQAHFEVLQGSPTVRAELLSMSDFRLFNRGRGHGALAATSNSRLAEFKKVISNPGQYAIVISNAKTGEPATISLELRVEALPRAGAATVLSPTKRMTIILLSFLFFAITAGWSGSRLLRLVHSGRN